MKERNKVTPAAYLILKKGEEVLFARRANTGYFNGYYSLPAGHVELGEMPSVAILREAREEIGVDIKEGDLKFVHSLYRSAIDETGDRIDYFFTAEIFSGEPKNCEPQKCDDVRWFSIDNLPEKLVPEVKHALSCLEQNQSYSEMPFEKKNLNPDRVG